MKNHLRHTCIVLGLLLAGCGGGSDEPTDESSSGGESAEHHGHHGEHHGEHHGHHEGHGEGHEHAELPPTVSAFHDVLAPVWHAEAGPSRAEAACAAHETFDARAAAIRDGGAPEGVDADAFAQAAAALVSATAELTRVCGEDAASAETTLEPIHDGFHGVVELLGAH